MISLMKSLVMALIEAFGLILTQFCCGLVILAAFFLLFWMLLGFLARI